jgi:plastocyanin
MSGMFRGTSVFNQSLTNWNVSSVTNMDDMFNTVLAFNQDLTGWCVSAISAEPSNFAASSALTEANKPLWGKEFKVALTSGTNSQTVTVNNAITTIIYSNTPICSTSRSANISGLPSGLSLVGGIAIGLNNGSHQIQGTPNETGTFNFTLTVSGASTSQAVTGTITVNAAVTADTTPPVISLLGSSTINLNVGDTFTDPGVTANDDVDGDVTLSITASGIVDTSTAGTYVITYSVTDTAGNTTTVDRTIVVSTVASSYSISVTASSNADYTLSGTDANGSVSGNDVSITINTGDTLNFNVDASSHPFYIKTAQGTGTDNLASGVSNNGATNGTVTWTPTTAGTYYYQCSAHNGMYGTITVQ